MVLTIPIGMDDEAEVRLRELPVARLEKVTSVCRDAVARHWNIFEHSLAYHRSVHIRRRHRDFQQALCR